MIRPDYYGGIYLLLARHMALPSKTIAIPVNVNCQLRNKTSPITLFAYRAHMHMHGVTQKGYLSRENTTMEIATGGPQTPQMFIPMKNEVTVDNGDVLATQCIFNTAMEDDPIYIGKPKTVYPKNNNMCVYVCLNTTLNVFRNGLQI